MGGDSGRSRGPPLTRQDASMPTEANVRPHPIATAPERLFDDPAAEERWRRRFTAVRAGLPHRARDAADRTWYVCTATGRSEIWCWDVATDRHLAATDRSDGTTSATL